MMFVHEPVSANFTSKLRQFPALHTPVFKQRLLPLVRFATSLAEKSRFVTLVCDFCSLTRSRLLASMTSSLPHRFCKTMQTVIEALIELKYNSITEMITNMDLTNESIFKECYTHRLFVRNAVFSLIFQCHSKDWCRPLQMNRTQKCRGEFRGEWLIYFVK